MKYCEEHVVVGLVQNELGKLLGNTIGKHATAIEFGIELVCIEEEQYDGQFLIVESRIGQIRILVMDLHRCQVTMMEQDFASLGNSKRGTWFGVVNQKHGE
jgi:hypothetical protein